MRKTPFRIITLTTCIIALAFSLVTGCKKDEEPTPTPVVDTKATAYTTLSSDEERPAMTSVFITLELDGKSLIVSSSAGDCNTLIPTGNNVPYSLEVELVGQVTNSYKTSGVLSGSNFKTGCNTVRVVQKNSAYALQVNGIDAVVE